MLDGSVTRAMSYGGSDRSITLQAYEPDVQVWAQKIRAAIATICLEHPAVLQIVLQPVVGGLMGAVCPVQCQPRGVRASYNAPYIEQATAIVVGDSPDLVAGFVPEVHSCGDYLDDVGHLAPTARGPIGLAIGQYLRALNEAAGRPSRRHHTSGSNIRSCRIHRRFRNSRCSGCVKT